LLVAIDGPAGAGKSTVARAVARELGFTYLDSGAMYRCVGLLSLEHPDAEPARLAADARIELAVHGVAGDGAAPPPRVLLDARDVTEAIRAPGVSQAASAVARDAGVREALVAKQRALIATGDWVAEGRDIGSVVAPDAAVKVYLTASAQERARRRASELGADLATVLADQSERDRSDTQREHSPLRPAAGALTLDTTGLSVEQVVERIAGVARAAAAAGAGWASDS
jgi:cytidylate kinase